MGTGPRTLYDKLWDAHHVGDTADGQSLLYIDRVILHEVSSAQAFEGLQAAGRGVWRRGSVFGVADHQVPTTDRAAGLAGIADAGARLQVQTLEDNCARTGVDFFPLSDARQGIVHVVGPEQGITLPGMTVVCGDSHTSTHGAFAALAHGIGTSEVEHVLATQCLAAKKAKNFRVWVDGTLGEGVTAKDLALAIIGAMGTAGGTGYTLEYAGPAIRALSMEGRMTLCNMAIEAGARAGLVAFDEVTAAYVEGRPYAPAGALWDQALEAWSDLVSDPDASFDRELVLDASVLEPQVSWGTSPEMVAPITGQVPDPAQCDDPVRAESWAGALRYMDLAAGQALTSIALDRVFIGSCTNSRIEDLRSAAAVARGRRVASTIKQALVVPGSGLVKRQAEEEGLDEIFRAAGFEWRDPGCSMCLAMNADRLGPGEHCASTSNRNFEGRQGHGGRTHLVSPAMAAAAAISGHFTDVRILLSEQGEQL